MMLSPHFSLEELTISDYAGRNGIGNSPPPSVQKTLFDTARNMELVRSTLGYPIHVSSGYRCAALNAGVGGANSSAHLSGYAVDFVCPQFGTPFDCAMAIAATQIAFDQLILEFGWAHISFAPPLRHQCLTKRSASAPYELGLRP